MRILIGTMFNSQQVLSKIETDDDKKKVCFW